MASLRTCPHGDRDRCLISGTELRRRLSEGKTVPPEFTRLEVRDILLDYYRNGGSTRPDAPVAQVTKERA